MIEGLKPYTEYRGSGQEWLGSIPAHWEVRRTKLLLREVDSRSKTGREQLLRVSQYTGVTERKASNGSDEPDTRATSLVGYKRVGKHDLVVNIMLAWNGSLGVSKFEGIASPAYCVYRFKAGKNPWYFHQLLRLPLFKGRIKTASTGVVESRLRLYSDDLGRIEAIVPPSDEQTAIVRFLDHANREIDGFIRAKRKLITLLGEQKQAIIHRAVTRGLNTNAPLKPSGFPWLGDIPAHWDVLSLKRVLRRLIDCEHKTAPVADNGELRVVRTTGIRHGRLHLHGTYGTTVEAFKEWTRRGVPEPGDVLFTREAPAGEACVMPSGIRLCMGQRTVLMKLRAHKINAAFLVHSIYAGPPRTTIMLSSQGSTVGHFNMADIGALAIFLPPLSEQVSIVNAIEKEAVPFDDAITRAEREMTLMQEYRTRLTADVVTGKLDVREAAAKLPDAPTDAIEPAQLAAEDETLEEFELDEPAD